MKWALLYTADKINNLSYYSEYWHIIIVLFPLVLEPNPQKISQSYKMTVSSPKPVQPAGCLINKKKPNTKVKAPGIWIL